MGRTYLAFLWHHHQPFYKDRVEGRYRMPWVRLHGTKDYYGMARLLRDAGGEVKATVNLVPSLIEQIEDYVAGTAADIHLSLSSAPAEELVERWKDCDEELRPVVEEAKSRLEALTATAQVR